MSQPRGPDIVIAGAQKAGTTGLFRSLGQTAGVVTPVAQEAMFLHDGQTWEQWSSQHLPGRFADGDRICIKLATLMYFADSLGRLYDVNPDARLLVVLRHPVDRLLSLHGYLTSLGLERRDLETALRDDYLQPGSRFRLDTYSGGSRYAEGIAHLHAAFPAAQTLVVAQADAGTVAGLRRVADFIGITDAVPVIRANESGTARSVALGRAMNAGGVRAIARGALPPAARQRARLLVRKLNTSTKASPRPTISHNLRAELLARHERDIVAAEQALGISLPDWRR